MILDRYYKHTTKALKLRFTEKSGDFAERRGN